MDFFPNIDVSALEAEAIARGLYAVALVDGIHERELALISDFYQGAAADESPDAMVSIERAGALEPPELAQHLGRAEVRDLFMRAAPLCAWADGKVSFAERAKIDAFAKALNVSDAALAALEAHVKDLLLRPLANLANVDAVTSVAKKLGV